MRHRTRNRLAAAGDVVAADRNWIVDQQAAAAWELRNWYETDHAHRIYCRCDECVRDEAEVPDP